MYTETKALIVLCLPTATKDTIIGVRHAIHYPNTTFSFLYGAFFPDVRCLIFIHLLK